MGLHEFDRALRRINAALEGYLSEGDGVPQASQLATDITVPLLERQEDQFLYHVVEHAADESVKDGEALDIKISALLAAQAAIAAIFIEKGWQYVAGAVVFAVLTGASMASLWLWKYQRAPNARTFVEDFIENQKAVRAGTILSKLAAIDRNERLVGNRNICYMVLLPVTIAVLLASLGWYEYNSYENGYRANAAGAVQGQPSGPGSPCPGKPPRNSVGGPSRGRAASC